MTALYRVVVPFLYFCIAKKSHKKFISFVSFNVIIDIDICNKQNKEVFLCNGGKH